jgi:uncharacterized membrane protein HdeD (DUF308 family)
MRSEPLEQRISRAEHAVQTVQRIDVRSRTARGMWSERSAGRLSRPSTVRAFRLICLNMFVRAERSLRQLSHRSKDATMATLTRSGSDPHGTKQGVGSVWGWFVGLGMLLVVLGALAFFNLPTADMVPAYTVGIVMLVGAAAQFGGAFLLPSRNGIGLLLLSMLLYGTAAILTIANPTFAAKGFMLVLALAVSFSGAMRIAWSMALRSLPGWRWITASGIFSVLAGIAFIAAWPAHAAWLLGTVLAVDLTFQGAMAIGWGVALKEIAK